ncbi:tetratricopeptide repeat protein [Portibacter lacus]|uniref:Peptide transporter n=1 Tax=Portibacter lacus TaxID=1099794 RepID=A0AA37STN7_9BACT|nr:tetratricopeptide repeat protein [Portibacter lacus]GLR18636.1 peptide transporter [Portibacter lacus]
MSCKPEKVEQQAPSVSIASDDPVLVGLTNAIAEDPNNADTYYERARILGDRELYDPAIDDLKKAISIDSSKAEYYHLLSDTYLDYFKSGEALDIMEKVVEKFPDRIPSLLKLAELQLILKQYDASFFTVQKIMNQDKQNAEAFFMLGMIYRAQGDKDRAINSFQSAVELDPEIIDAWVILGDLFAEKDFKIAGRYYDNAIRLDPENLQAYHAKAFYLQNSNRTSEAIKIYKEINQRDPQYTDAYLNTGILYLDQDSLPQAFEHFDILVKIDPQNYLGYYYRGITRMFQGDKDGARADLNQALVFNSTFEKAQIALSELDKL